MTLLKLTSSFLKDSSGFMFCIYLNVLTGFREPMQRLLLIRVQMQTHLFSLQIDYNFSRTGEFATI